MLYSLGIFLGDSHRSLESILADLSRRFKRINETIILHDGADIRPNIEEYSEVEN